MKAHKDKTEHMLRPGRTAAVLGVTVTTLANWRKIPYGPDWVQYGGIVRYSSADVLAFRQAHMQRPA